MSEAADGVPLCEARVGSWEVTFPSVHTHPLSRPFLGTDVIGETHLLYWGCLINSKNRRKLSNIKTKHKLSFWSPFANTKKGAQSAEKGQQETHLVREPKQTVCPLGPDKRLPLSAAENGFWSPNHWLLIGKRVQHPSWLGCYDGTS